MRRGSACAATGSDNHGFFLLPYPCRPPASVSSVTLAVTHRPEAARMPDQATLVSRQWNHTGLPVARIHQRAIASRSAACPHKGGASGGLRPLRLGPRDHTIEGRTAALAHTGIRWVFGQPGPLPSPRGGRESATAAFGVIWRYPQPSASCRPANTTHQRAPPLRVRQGSVAALGNSSCAVALPFFHCGGSRTLLSVRQSGTPPA